MWMHMETVISYILHYIVRDIIRRKMKGVVKLFKVKKAISQIGFLVAGVVMLCYGAMRGEADTVLSKAIRICLEWIGIG